MALTMPASWKTFAAAKGGFSGEGEVRFRFEGGRVSMFRGDFKTRHSARCHGLEPGEYTVLVRTLERRERPYAGQAPVDVSALPAGTQSMIDGRVARVFLPGFVLETETLERALSALGALEREG